MAQYTPRELEAHVEAQVQCVGTKAFLTQDRHKRLREMWCAARLALGYSNFIAECVVEIASEDEDREFDFHLCTSGLRLPFQVAEVLDSGRRRGDEYNSQSKEEVAALHNERDFEPSSYAARRVHEELLSKASKHYAGAESLHILLYLNVKASSVAWASLAEGAESAAAHFASVWVVSQDLFCCLRGGSMWPSLAHWRAIEREV
ncbi:MAG TPA: hypothetical protein VHM00_08725 [Caldimonas sp.]|nr:hypothetical protein [Caldimonas sp.]HEX2541152.1 hypothetical protein [Caldimonas sp.]